jgi:hypothetical protein
MLTMLVAAVAVSTALVVAHLATTPSRRSSQERRRRYVDRHPAMVNLGDVERRLADELPAHHHDFVMAEVGRRRIDAATLWTWLGQHGAESLVLALASDGGYAGLLRRLRTEAPLDHVELELLAHLSRPELFVEVAFQSELGLAA